ncbi:MAG: RNA polymerase factor sigma-54 [Anaerovoracaceae bacterium]
MKLGYDLNIEQQQKLVMTPELIQAIKILQFNNQELDSYVKEQILTNPILESAPAERETEKEKTREDAIAEYLQEYGKNGSRKDTSYSSGDYDNDDEGNSFEKYVASGVSLQEHLMFQLQFVTKCKKARRIGKYIIESLDDNGYMTLSVEEVSKLIGEPLEKVNDILEIIQNFDPIGVCAINLADCLKRQLEQKGLLSYEAEMILDSYIEEIAANKLGLIGKKLGITTTQVQEIRDLIRTLDPRPGLQFCANIEPNYITPDILVTKDESGEYIVTTNDSSVPKLMVSSYYEKLLKESKNDTQLTEYLSDRMESAVWVMRSIEQRKQTILNVAKAIIKYQEGFLEEGKKALKTMTLKEIAEELEIHESTVSRSINGKYMQCSRGVFELKYFFSAGVSSSDGEGGISSNSIKSHIRELVDGEEPKSPLSDQKLVELLKERKIEISRRTIAKYRDEMGIPSSSKRKRY